MLLICIEAAVKRPCGTHRRLYERVKVIFLNFRENSDTYCSLAMLSSAWLGDFQRGYFFVNSWLLPCSILLTIKSKTHIIEGFYRSKVNSASNLWFWGCISFPGGLSRCEWRMPTTRVKQKPTGTIKSRVIVNRIFFCWRLAILSSASVQTIVSKPIIKEKRGNLGHNFKEWLE